MNKVILIGRITKNIELKSTPNGKEVADFSIAVKRNYKNQNGEYEADFINCISFGKTAELLGKYTKKGDQIAIEGRINTRNYENKEGKKVYITEILVENIMFLETKQSGQVSGQVSKQVSEQQLDPYETFGEAIEHKGTITTEEIDDMSLPF